MGVNVERQRSTLTRIDLGDGLCIGERCSRSNDVDRPGFTLIIEAISPVLTLAKRHLK
jgi:hypothetical protein